MLKFLEKILGSKHDKDVKRLLPIVDEINEEYEKLQSLSDEELKAKTTEFRTLIAERTKEFQEEIGELRTQLRTQELSHSERIEIYDSIGKLEKEEHDVIQDTFIDILPQAFAVVKDACRRLVGTTYDVAGTASVWDMVPYDVQLIGGIVIHEGKIAEMATGEGKTLVAVAPVYLNALAGRGVHLVTVNDYLALRDSQWMGLVYNYLGMTVGCIQSNMPPHLRKAQYNADITYGTNNEYGFDYLRDNMVGTESDMVQRAPFFAIVDEVDSVLVDEARTPLIISGPVPQTDQRFEEMNPLVRNLVDMQKRLAAKLTAEAEALLQGTGKEDREKAGVALLRAYRGFPKNNRLIKTLSNPDYQKLLRDTELEYLRDQGTKMNEIDEELYYSIDEKNHQIDLTEKGREFMSTSRLEKDFFVIPDIATELSALEGDHDLDAAERDARKDAVMRLYAERSDRIHTVTQLLRAYSLYEKDVEYVVDDGKIKIVDEFTGRILEGRRYSDGLHQAIEAKEGVHVERDTQTMATVTLQNYFRLYSKLAGMTGTAETEAGEFYEIYKLDVVVIPTNRPIVRKDMNDLIFRTKREKYNAVVEEIQKQVAAGRAVLVGTTSVEVSEVLSKMLKRANVRHNVLNAKQHQREAEIVAEAGRKGAVTIATNMAGRGTDIKLAAEVKQSGGLCIIGTERHEARRIDRQLRGRAGRQGDPGTSQFFLSLEDDLMRLFGGERVAGIMQRLKVPEGEPIEHKMMTNSVERAQKKVEENNFSIRKRLLEYDNVMNQQREVIYDRRRHALRGERLKGELFEFVEETAGEWFDEYQPNVEVQKLRDDVRKNFLCEIELDENGFRSMTREACISMVVEAARQVYTRKEQMLGAEFMGNLERVAVLQTIDDKWREHLRAMDDLKEGIHLRAYGQKDPLVEYKGEAYKLFVELIGEINRESVHFAFAYFPQVVERPAPAQNPEMAGSTVVQRTAPPRAEQPIAPTVTAMSTQMLSFSHPSVTAISGMAPAARPSAAPAPVDEQGNSASHTVTRSEPRVGRNELCPCGSGKKYKHCHGK